MPGAENGHPLPAVRLGADVTVGWLRDYRQGWDDAGTAGRRAAAYATVVKRLGSGGVIATVDLDGAPAGIGLGAVERGWLGLFGLATRPEARGRGVGTAVVGSLVRWGRGEGATGAYLQVEDDNTTARSLFATVGFSPHHRYHYRILRPTP
jgi:GNAT superfamily N-acetyltransferase